MHGFVVALLFFCGFLASLDIIFWAKLPFSHNHVIKICFTFNFWFFEKCKWRTWPWSLLRTIFRCTQSVTNLSKNTTAGSISHHAKGIIPYSLVDFPVRSCVTKFTSTVLTSSRSLQKLTPVNFTHHLMTIPNVTNRKSTVQNQKRHLMAVWSSMTFHPEVRPTTVVTCSLI